MAHTLTRSTARLGVAALTFALAAAACSSTSDTAGTTGGSASGGGGGGGKKIALLLPESKTARYESQDKPLFTAKVQSLCGDCQVIYNNANQDIGQIKDIAMGQNGRSQAYILSVGGFLGMGEHYVAVSPSAVKVSYNSSEKKWHASMNASADQLKAAPEFKYAGRWDASKT